MVKDKNKTGGVMDDLARIVGRLEEFQKWSSKEFESIREEFNLIREDLKPLHRLRWMVMGQVALVSLVSTVVLEFLFHRS